MCKYDVYRKHNHLLDLAVPGGREQRYTFSLIEMSYNAWWQMNTLLLFTETYEDFVKIWEQNKFPSNTNPKDTTVPDKKFYEMGRCHITSNWPKKDDGGSHANHVTQKQQVWIFLFSFYVFFSISKDIDTRE